MNRTRAKQRADRIVRQAARKRRDELTRQQFERDMAIVEGTLNASQALVNSVYAKPSTRHQCWYWWESPQTPSDSP